MSMTNQLLLFFDVVQQGSFTKAAALHDMDNSSLSKQIKKLESELGVQLLNRSTRSFSLTSAGKDILEQTHTLRDTLNHIQLVADSYQKQPKGILRITSPIYFGQEHLQPVISKFIKTYPDVQIVHALDDKKSDIISDHFDLAFRLGKLQDSSLFAKKIADTHFILIASKAFIELHGELKTPSQLLDLPAVIYSNGDVTLDQVTINRTVGGNEFDTYKIKGQYRVSDVRTQINAVRDGLGYSVIDVSNLSASLEELELTQILPELSISTMDTAIYAIYPHKKHTMLAQAFIQAVQDYIGHPPRWLNHV